MFVHFLGLQRRHHAQQSVSALDLVYLATALALSGRYRPSAVLLCSRKGLGVRLVVTFFLARQACRL
jgi:hypothetical protein